MNTTNKTILTILALAVVGGGAYAVLTMPDNRGAGEKFDDAVEQLDNGVDDAARELEDRTPAERIKDNINDATDGDAN